MAVWHARVLAEAATSRRLPFLVSLLLLLPARGTASSPEVVLYTGVGSSNEGENVWHGWYHAGGSVEEGVGKRGAYDTLPLKTLHFSDDAGRWATYHLLNAYQGRTLLEIVQSCLHGDYVNHAGPVWADGHCTIGKLLGSTGIENIAGELRLGVGDLAGAVGDENDWALFMLQVGHGGGDFQGTDAYAFGSERETNTGHPGKVSINGTAWEAGEHEPETTGPVATTATVTTTVPPWVLLFAGKGKSKDGENVWPGWYNNGGVVEDGNGKYATYDNLPLTELRFHDQRGNWAEYSLHAAYRGRTLLQIVQGCLGEKRVNNGGDTWLNGHCSVGVLTTHQGLSGLSAELRLGVGDAAGNEGDELDWALFMLEEGNGGGDFQGTDTYAFGSERETNTGTAASVYISGKPWQDPSTTMSKALDTTSVTTSTVSLTETANALFQAVPNLFEGQMRPVWHAPKEDWDPQALLFNLTLLAHFEDPTSAFLDAVADTSTMLLTSMLLQRAHLMRIQAPGLSGFSGAGALVLEFAISHTERVETKLAALSADHGSFTNRFKAVLARRGYVVPEGLRTTVDPTFHGPEEDPESPWPYSPSRRWTSRSLLMLLIFCGVCFFTCCLIGIWSGCNSLKSTKPPKKGKELKDFPDLEGMEATCPPPLAVQEPVTFSLSEAQASKWRCGVPVS